MRSIVPRPPPEEDDFFSPQLIAFAAAAMAGIGAIWSLLGLWLVYDNGCFSGECESNGDGFGLGLLVLLAGQVSLAVPTVALCIRMLSSGDAPRGAVNVTLVGVAATIAIVGITLFAVWSGT